MRTKVLLSALVLFALLTSCNMPAGVAPVTQPPGNQPVSLDTNAMATAVELTAIARVTEIAGSAMPAGQTFTATPTATFTTAPVSGSCSPLITANTVVNVRGGPDTAYDVIGSLSMGQTANIVGRNDAYTWWYIDYPGVASNHGWVSGSVVTASCVPAIVQVVAAPPLPTAVVADNSSSSDNSDNNSGDSGDSNNSNLINPQLMPKPELHPIALLSNLVPMSMQVSSNPAFQGVDITVSIKVKNTGLGKANGFTVQWWATGSKVGCHWNVPSLAAGATKVLTCSYNYNAHGTFTIKTVVDSAGVITESDENDNVTSDSMKVNVLIQKIPVWP